MQSFSQPSTRQFWMLAMPWRNTQRLLMWSVDVYCWDGFRRYWAWWVYFFRLLPKEDVNRRKWGRWYIKEDWLAPFGIMELNLGSPWKPSSGKTLPRGLRWTSSIHFERKRKSCSLKMYTKTYIFVSFRFRCLGKWYVHTNKFTFDSGWSSLNRIVFIIFWLIWNQTKYRLVQNQSENGKYNLISENWTRISEVGFRWFLENDQ